MRNYIRGPKMAKQNSCISIILALVSIIVFVYYTGKTGSVTIWSLLLIPAAVIELWGWRRLSNYDYAWLEGWSILSSVYGIVNIYSFGWLIYILVLLGF